MRIVFMGTPDYAATALKALIEAGHQVVGVFTQPDKPKGRGGKVQEPPVKILAREHGIPVCQPRRIRTEGVEALKTLAPDLCVTAAFGQILSQEILDIPPLGTVNVHASLLPKYRGSSPVHWAIVEGESVTGITTMMTDAGIDTGDILLQAPLISNRGKPRGTDRPPGSAGGGAAAQDPQGHREGKCPRTPQDEQEMSYFPLLTRETGAIDWRQPASSIVNRIHGLNPGLPPFHPPPGGR